MATSGNPPGTPPLARGRSTRSRTSRASRISIASSVSSLGITRIETTQSRLSQLERAEAGWKRGAAAVRRARNSLFARRAMTAAFAPTQTVSGNDNQPRNLGLELMLVTLAERARRRLSDMVVERMHQWNCRAPSVTRRATALFISGYKKGLFLTGHVLLTLLIWSHFFLKKFRTQEDLISDTITADAAVAPEDVGLAMPNYWMKRLGTPLLFGCKHAILWQLAWIPITMNRHFLTWASRTSALGFLPYEHMATFHIYLGYGFCSLTILATVLFFFYFGKGCYDHRYGSPRDPTDFCEKLTSEIFTTGLCLSMVVLVIFCSSFFRRHLRYEVFYAMHHLVFVIYALAVMHTLDREFREGTAVGRQRSQDYRFFTASVAIYVIDRTWVHFSKRTATMFSASVSDDGTVLMLTLEKPDGMEYVSGQYVYLHVPEIDHTWHPFSISSSPEMSTLQFYIMAHEGQWTEQLLEYVSDATNGCMAIKVDIMGPFGSCIMASGHYDNVLLFSTGTGVAPMMSLMRGRFDKLKYLNDDLFSNYVPQVARTHHRKLMPSTELALRTLQFKARQKSIEKMGDASPYIKNLMKDIEERHVMFDLVAHLFVAGDVCQAFFTFSWAELHDHGLLVTRGQWTLLEALSLTSAVFFLVHRLYVWWHRRRYALSVCSLIDMVAVISMLSVHVAWALEEPETAYTTPTVWQRNLRIVFACWRVGRILLSSEELREASAWEGVDHSGLLGSDSFHNVWVTRTAGSCLMMLNELQPMYTLLEEKFSRARLKRIFGLTIYVTNSKPEERDALQNLIRSSIFKDSVKFEMPDLKAIVANDMNNKLRKSLYTSKTWSSRTFVGFCGSPVVANILKDSVVRANMLASALEQPQCHMTLRVESYGVLAGKSKKSPHNAPKAARAAEGTWGTRVLVMPNSTSLFAKVVPAPETEVT